MHRYEEFPGGHDWAYWQSHVADSLRFFAEALQEGAAGKGMASVNF